jgi:hypothetical protein
MIDRTSEFKLKILRQASSLGCEPRPKIVRCGKHRKRGVDQLRVITEAGLGASRLDQSWINTGAKPLGARALKFAPRSQCRKRELDPCRRYWIN